MTRIGTLLMLGIALILSSASAWGQTSQQLIGSFPTMDGGFEGQANGVLTGTSIATGVQRTDWTTSSSNLGTIYGSGGRSSPKYMNAWTTSTAKRWQSPTVAEGVITNTQYTVQYYYRTTGATGTAKSMQIGASPDGTGSPTYNPSSVPYDSLPGTTGAWVKWAKQVTPAAGGAGKYGIGIIRANTPTMATAIDVDDFVMYPGTEDNTSPDAPTAASVGSPTASSLLVGWTAPGTGVDGGGYIVVRKQGSDPTTTPNANGLYAVGNSVATGEQVVYIGTATSFTDNGLSSGAQYFYRVYTVDKAFNYSTAATASGTTSSPSITVTGTLTDFGFVAVGTPSVEQTYTVSGGDLVADLVVTAPSTDFEVSRTSGSGFASSISFTPSGGVVPTSTVYVRFNPQSAGAKFGNVSNASSGVITQNVAVNGTGIDVPALTAPTASTVTVGGATLGATINTDNGSAVTSSGVAYASLPNPTTPTVTTSPTITSGPFTVEVSGLSSNTLYHYRGFATNSVGTSYTSDATFTTLADAPVGVAASSIGSAGFTANWNAVSGTEAVTYRLDVSTDNSFGSLVTGYNDLNIGSGTSYGVTGLSSSTTYYYRVRAMNTGGASTNSNTITVSTTSPIHNVTQDTYYPTIQAAVDAANPGDEIDVAAGTFHEQVFINKNLTLHGAGASNTTIAPPATLMAQLFSPDRAERPIIGVGPLGTSVIIEGFTVDGEGAGNTQASMSGIQYFKASGIIRYNTVKRVRSTPFDGTQAFIGVMANHDFPNSYTHTVEIANNTVEDFGKGGIVCNHPGLVANVHHNIVTGQGPTALNAQNGIQFGYGATGTIAHNTVSGVVYTGPSWSASGLLAVATDGTLDINNNTVTNAAVGVYLSQNAGYAGGASAVVTSNSFTASTAGLGGQTDCYGSITYSLGGAVSAQGGSKFIRSAAPFEPQDVLQRNSGRFTPATTMSATYAGNSFTNTSATATGVGLYLLALGTSPQTVGLTDNSVTGWEYGVVTDKDAGATLTSTLRQNVISGNTTGMYDFTNVLQDARENWWGDATGPYDNKTLPAIPNYSNPTGLGNPVSSNIDYSPFYLDAARTTLSIYTLTLTATTGGAATKSPDQTSYNHGTIVTLTATPDSGYHFVSWTGDASDTTNPLTLTMTSSKNFTANFALDEEPLHITTASPLPNATAGAAYSQTLAATGGTPPYSNWQVIVGSLPSGLSLNSSTGEISGTPTVAAISTFTVQVSDAALMDAGGAKGRNSLMNTATKEFTLTVDAGPLHHFAVGTISSPQVAGTAFNISITAQDANNNTVTGFTGTVGLATTAGTISPTTTASFVLGVLNENVAVTQSGTGKTISVDDGSGHTGTSNTFDIDPGALHHFAIGTIASPQVAGTAFTVSITAQDANNNTVTGFTGTVGLSTTAGTISPTTSGSFAAGTRNEDVTVTLAGAGKTISVDDGSGHTATSNTFDVHPGSLDHFAINIIASPQIQNVAFNLVMTAKDANNNTVTSFTSTVSIALSSGMVSPTTSGSFVAGSRTEAVTVSTPGSGLTISVDDGSSHIGTSNSFDVIVPTPYRSAVASGNWNAAGSWELFDGSNWTAASIAPTTAEGTIEIRSGHNITVSASVSADQVTIDAGGRLTVAAGQTLAVANGADSIDVAVSGILDNFGTVTATGRVSFENGGLYINSVQGGGTIPVFTWRTGSTCRIDSSGTNGPSGLNANSLYNLIWNATNQSANGGPNFNDGTVIGGDVTVMSSKGVQFRLVNLSSGQTKNIYIRGNMNVSGSTAVLTSTGSGADTAAKAIINIDGNVAVSNGTWNFCNSSAAYAEWRVKGHVIITGGTMLGSGSSGWAGRRMLDFSGGATQNFSVTSPGVIGTATATFKSSNASAVNVNFPWSLMNGGILNLAGGTFVTTSSNLITIPTTGSVIGGSSSSYVKGPLAITVASTSPTTKTFPIGKSMAYRPVTLTVNQDAATATVYTAEVFNTAPPSRTLPSTLSDVSAVRYYNITKGVGANLSPTLGATVQLSYDTDDGVASATLLRVAKDTGATYWANLGGSGTGVPAGAITSNAFYTFSDFVLATADTGAATIPPTVLTTAMSYISTTTAWSGGNVTNDGGAAVSTRGVCWNTGGNPTTADSKTIDGSGSGVFASLLAGLTPGATYHVRAYATNSAGTGYGDEVVFSALASIIPPSVTTTALSNIQVTTAVSGGTVSDWGGDSVFARGACWNTTGSPTLSNSHSLDGAGLGSFASGLSPLIGGTLYYVRAYASNSAGTGYGNELSFTTQIPQPDTTVVVAQDGSGNYLTVQAAFNAVPTGYTGKWTIFVRRGVYYEKCLLATGKNNVTLQGESRDSTIITYDDYADRYGSGNPGTSGSYSVAIDASDFTAKDITFRNTYAPQPGVVGTQAVALRTQGDRHEYINCRILGYQDTYYTYGGNGTGRMYHRDCFIEGTVDFIFGRNIAVFDNCTIHEIRGNGACITAAATDGTSQYGYVFRNCTIRADSIGYDGQPITSFYLGRPWQGSPRTVFINNHEPWNLNAAGWLAWNATPALYAEFNSYGVGSPTGGRVAWSSQLTGPVAATYSLSNIFARTSASSPLILYDWMPAHAATDQPLPMRVAAFAGANGSISPEDTTNVSYGGSQSYSILPAAGYHVDSVYVDGTSIAPVLSYTFTNVIANHTISTTFAQNAATEFTLAVNATNGTVTKDPDLTVYSAGTWVHLTATPSAGYHFVNWTDSLVSSNNPDSILMNSDKVVTANFAINTYALNVTTIGSGSITKDPDQPTYAHGSSVTLMAIPGGGWFFTGWSGDTTGVANPLVLTMNSEKNVTGTFAPMTMVKLSNGTGGGLWSNPGTWQGGIVPGDADTAIIVGSDSVTVDVADSCQRVVVESAAELAIVDTLRSSSVGVSGRLINFRVLMASGSVVFDSASVYQHALNNGSIPVATWNAGSTCLVSGYVSGSKPANSNQNFHNFTWNCSGQTATVDVAWYNNTVHGDINILSTGTGRLQLTSPSAGSPNIITIMGNISVASGNFTSNGSSSGATITIEDLGDITVTGGNFSATRGSGPVVAWNLYGNLTMSNATTQNSSASSRFVFKKTGTQILALSNITFAGGGLPIEVNSGTTLDAGTSTIRGSGVFTLNSGATLQCGNTGGLDSLLAGTGTKSLSTGANYTFGGSAAQVTGLLLPGAVNDLTINNTADVTLTDTVAVNGTLAFVSGKLNTGSNLVIVLAPGSISGAGAGKYVNGQLMKTVTVSGGGGSQAFEIGDALAYAPVLISGTSYASPFDVVAHTTGSEHPSIVGSGIDSAKSVNRYYTLVGTPTGPSDVTFNFVSGDIDAGADTNQFVVGKFDASIWTFPTVGVRTSTNTQAIGVSGFSEFAIGEQTLAVFGVSPGSLNFGSVFVTSSREDSVQITNTGTGSLTISDITSSLITEFSVTETTPVVVGPSSNVWIHITFHPTSDGVKSGIVSFTHNGVTSPDTVSVEGVGFATVNVSVPLDMGWNMISNPVTVTNDSVRALYPTADFSYAFNFTTGGPSAGYNKDTTMENGRGYWARFPATSAQTVTGLPRTRDSISVLTGWNMIGTISNPVDTATIVSDPPGLKTSHWFGFSSTAPAPGYAPATTLIPGLAYWVKANGAGKFVLAYPVVTIAAKSQGSGVSAEEMLNSLTVTDSRGHAQTLYFGADANNEIPVEMFAMPPAPPLGVLDARFTTSDGGAMVQTHAAKVTEPVEFGVKVQSDAYPLTISWSVTRGEASYELTDGTGGRVFLPKEMRGEGSVRITNSALGRFTVRLIGDGTIPTEYALMQNYPNPFNPTTNVKYALPIQSKVVAEVYNMLGQMVRTLVNDDQVAGYHVMGWDGKGSGSEQMASGTYFLRLTATGVNGKSFTAVRKLMMLK